MKTLENHVICILESKSAAFPQIIILLGCLSRFVKREHTAVMDREALADPLGLGAAHGVTRAFVWQVSYVKQMIYKCLSSDIREHTTSSWFCPFDMAVSGSTHKVKASTFQSLGAFEMSFCHAFLVSWRRGAHLYPLSYSIRKTKSVMSGKKTIEESDFGDQCGRTDLKSRLFFFFLKRELRLFL